MGADHVEELKNNSWMVVDTPVNNIEQTSKFATFSFINYAIINYDILIELFFKKSALFLIHV